MSETVNETAGGLRVATPETGLSEDAVESLRGSLRGALLRPGDEGYDAARAVWNGMIDRRPELIVRCTGVADVIAAVTFARANDLLMAVRGGGHSVAGLSVCDGGIVIDLSPMKGIRVDPVRRTARVEPGVKWGELDRETQTFGLAVPGGVVSTTGIAGLTLGGGQGWLGREYGLALDNLVSVDVVTADGAFLSASAEENSDLMWGVRGGGGNFGVVSSFEYRLNPVGPIVLAGPVFYPADRAVEVLRGYRDFFADAPDEVAGMAAVLTAPPAPFLPESAHGSKVVAIVLCYVGDPQGGEAALAPLRSLADPVVDLVGPMPYTALQALFDEGQLPGRQNYWKSSYVNVISNEAIETFVAYATNAPSPLTTAYFLRLEGAIGRVAEDETAYSHRRAAYDFASLTVWTDPREDDKQISWSRDFWQAMQPYAADAVYVNNLGDEGDARVREAYGEAKYDRLVALKDKYDPTNLFRLNQNIQALDRGPDVTDNREASALNATTHGNA
jgi:FAD/FMN-containing dehydrogenase